MENNETNRVNVLDKGFVRLVDTMGDDSSIVSAARVSYGVGTKKVSEDEGLIRYLMRHGHTTPFEMCQFKFHIKAPIFVFRQWHRHRTWSFNEYSGRYSEMKDEFYVPEKTLITKQNPINKQGGTSEIIEDAAWHHEEFQTEQTNDYDLYQDKLKSGMRKELARINLPVSNYSEMYASVDLHNLFHFLRLRLDSHAQYEIRVYAEAISQMVKQIVPIAWQAFEDYQLNSLRLTKKDQEVIKHIVSCGHRFSNFAAENVAKLFITNKRELQECLDKLKNLGLITNIE